VGKPGSASSPPGNVSKRLDETYNPVLETTCLGREGAERAPPPAQHVVSIAGLSGEDMKVWNCNLKDELMFIIPVGVLTLVE